MGEIHPKPTPGPDIDIGALEADEPRSTKARLRGPLLLVAPIAVIAALLYFYLTGARYELTDDASLQTGQVGITASVNGKVIAIEVQENQVVTAGQVLFRINPESYQLAVDEAAAQLAAARTNIDSLRADYRQAEFDFQAARARLDYAQREAERKKSLLDKGFSSRAQYDEAVMAEQTARQAMDSAHAKSDSVRASLSGDVDTPTDTQPAVRRAEAALKRARIALGDTVVNAPQDGIVTRVNQLQIGNYVTVSRPVFVLSGKHVWVQANFKENQLRHMRLGQTATVKIDAYPDRKLKAHITSFSPGTGNSFSLLPAENATGNWVKVVQRLPVELALDDIPQDLRLHAGLSVEVTVDTGHRRHLLGPDTPPTTPPPAPDRLAPHP